MISTGQSGGRVIWRAIASGMAVWIFSASLGLADDGMAVGPIHNLKLHKNKNNSKNKGPKAGTLGYGAPGIHPGFQGFGLGFHPGYGYGGKALGVGAEGGYPFYGGPGYPHSWPQLQRIGGIAPFCHDRGPGSPSPEHPNYFGGIGPLVPDQPVVKFLDDPRLPPYQGGYGTFDGSFAYPESTFAPFTTIAGTSGSASEVSSASPTTAPPIPSTAVGRLLGFDAEPFDNRGQGLEMRINIVVPGGLAEKAGLHVNDMIQSINGYFTRKPSDLAWILENAASDKMLKMNVQTTNDDKVHEFTLQLP